MKKLRAEAIKDYSKFNRTKIKLKQREDLIEGKKKQRIGSRIKKELLQPV